MNAKNNRTAPNGAVFSSLESAPLDRLSAPLLAWYPTVARDLPWRRSVSPYAIWISEIMLQQTRVQAVIGYYERFLAALPDIPALAAVPEEQLLKLWEGLGYYSRARNLQKTAQILTAQYGGQLPADYAALRALPGIGPYTAGAIASFAFGLPEPAVDGNVLRVLSRFASSDVDILLPALRRRVEQLLRGVMPSDPGTFNQALIELGATVCGPDNLPACTRCPLAADCAGLRLGTAAALPYKTPKQARHVSHRTVYLLRRGNLIAMRKRPVRGLLAGLWEMPALEEQADAARLTAHVRALGLEPLRLRPLGNHRHVFTHLEWVMEGWVIEVAEAVPVSGLSWVSLKEVRTHYALPSAFKPFLEQLFPILP